MQIAADQQVTVVPVPIAVETAMDVDAPATGEVGTKRKADDTDAIAESSKKARIGKYAFVWFCQNVTSLHR